MTTTVTTATDTHLISPTTHSVATTQEQQLLQNLLPSNTFALLEQHFREQQTTASVASSSRHPPFAEQLQRVLGSQSTGGLTLVGLQHQDMPAPWQALVQQAQQDSGQLHSPLPGLSDLSGKGMTSTAPMLPPNNLVATALDAVMRSSVTGGVLHAAALSPVLNPATFTGPPANSISRLGASSLALSGDAGGSRAAPRQPPKLGRAHLKEELLINQMMEIHQLTGKALPRALVKAQELMAVTGHLPPDTVIPPCNAVWCCCVGVVVGGDE